MDDNGLPDINQILDARISEDRRLEIEWLRDENARLRAALQEAVDVARFTEWRTYAREWEKVLKGE